jgi:hypothetical protein
LGARLATEDIDRIVFGAVYARYILGWFIHRARFAAEDGDDFINGTQYPRELLGLFMLTAIYAI